MAETQTPVSTFLSHVYDGEGGKRERLEGVASVDQVWRSEKLINGYI
jgi:hypothetical protein